ncbi:MAG: hypothetical protein M5U31_16170 [Acidimicrobiia bacterium]|nr:hypothetical protein [Acidimicrobiia bacterium]
MGAKRVGDPSVYEAADLIREKCWLEDGSAFTPGETVWTRESFEELTRDFVGEPRNVGQALRREAPRADR